MRRFALAVALVTTLGSAQSPLNALNVGGNGGDAGGGLYFDMTVSTTVTLTQIDVLCGPAPAPPLGLGSTPAVGTSICELWLGPTTYVGNVTNAALWTPVVTGTGTIGPNMLASFVLNIPIALGPGSYGVALKSVQTAAGGNAQWGFAYTNGLGNNTPLVCGATPGSCLNSAFANTELTVRAGAAQNQFLVGSIFQPRIFNGAIHYTLGGTPVSVASTEPYGAGCYNFYHSFRELFPNPVGFDLENGAGTNSILMTLNAEGGYDVGALNPAGTFFPPGTGVAYAGGPTPGTPVITANGTLAAIPLPFPMLYPTVTGPGVANTIEVSDDGYVSPAGTATAAPLPPTAAALLSGPPRWAPFYHDQDPVPPLAGAGVFVDLDPTLTKLYVTWKLLPVNNGAGIDPSTFQLMLRANGDVEYRYQAMSGSGGALFPIVTGWSVGGGVLDPGQRDLSATAPFATRPGPVGVPGYPNDNPGVSLVLSGRPRLGTTPNLVTSNIPTGTPLGVNILSFVQIPAGLDLAGFGAPGCRLFANTPPSTNVVFIVGPPGATTSSLAFPIPNNAAFNGILVFCQSATFTTGYNALGILFSNGVRMLVGSL